MPHRANRTYVSNADALTAWTPIAREVLLDAARSYRATVNDRELAARVQEESGIAADQLAAQWIGKLLERVAADAHRRGDPPLASLCLTQEGSISDEYRATPEAALAPDDADLDQLAAEHRLACYRVYADDLPADGGTPLVPPRIASRRPPRARAAASRPIKTVVPTLRETTCTSCFMIVVARETCTSCGAPLPA
jgi:hypothetical protein